MPTGQVTVCNDLGLHARAAARLVDLANRFESDVRVSREHRTINGKSIMGVLTLAAAKGTDLKIEADGNDEQEALEAIFRAEGAAVAVGEARTADGCTAPTRAATARAPGARRASPRGPPRRGVPRTR